MERAGLEHLLDRANVARRAGRSDAAAEQALAQAFGGLLRLAVYGTLAPGEPNHDQLVACPGHWRSGTVRGWRRDRDYPELTPDPAGPAVRVQVLDSAALAEAWERLDAFEGEDYRRELVAVRLDDGATTVANIYAAARGR